MEISTKSRSYHILVWEDKEEQDDPITVHVHLWEDCYTEVHLYHEQKGWVELNRNNPYHAYFLAKALHRALAKETFH